MVDFDVERIGSVNTTLPQSYSTIPNPFVTIKQIWVDFFQALQRGGIADIENPRITLLQRIGHVNFRLTYLRVTDPNVDPSIGYQNIYLPFLLPVSNRNEDLFYVSVEELNF